MNKESRYERLVRKYQGTGTKTRKSEMRITGGPDREKAMRVSGKPKNMKKTIARLAEYLTQDRKLLVIAVLCTILNAVTALAGAERVFEVLEEEPETEEADVIRPEKIIGRVEVDHVDFGYVPEQPVLHDITLYAKPGQKVAFVGSTGAGKTTVTNLLPRFYELPQEKSELTAYQ